MSYKRPMRWEPGQTLIACDICGFPYLFPSEMVRADDKRLYCLRTCWLGKTALGDARERAAAARLRREQEYPRVTGTTPSWRDE